MEIMKRWVECLYLRMCSNTLNIIGLSLDIIGVIGLFFFKFGGGGFVPENYKIINNEKWYALVSLIAIVVGFLFQITANL